MSVRVELFFSYTLLSLPRPTSTRDVEGEGKSLGMVVVGSVGGLGSMGSLGGSVSGLGSMGSLGGSVGGLDSIFPPLVD